MYTGIKYDVPTDRAYPDIDTKLENDSIHIDGSVIMLRVGSPSSFVSPPPSTHSTMSPIGMKVAISYSLYCTLG